MILKSYTLPSWEMVSGEDKERQITLRHENGSLYSLPSSTAEMTVVDFVNRDATPVLTLQQTIVNNEDGVQCVLNLVLSAANTKTLHGKYLYCVTITDKEGNIAKLRGTLIAYDDASYVT